MVWLATCGVPGYLRDGDRATPGLMRRIAVLRMLHRSGATCPFGFTIAKLPLACAISLSSR